MKILVTGAGGQLGRDLLEHLQTGSETVHGATRAELDLCDTVAVQRLLHQMQPDWIINCAAWTAVDDAEDRPQDAFALNRDAVAELTREADAVACRVLHLSTDYVFSGEGNTPWREEDPTAPIGVYGRSKLEGEQAVLASPGRHTVLRTSWLYGVHGKNFVKTMLRLARERDELRVVNDQFGSPTWSHDLAEAIGVLLHQGATGLYHYANRGRTSWHAFACAILEEARPLGFDVRARRVVAVSSDAFPTRARRPACSVLDTRRIQALLPAPIPGWRDSLRRMLRALAAAGLD
ncbi:MAG TPA: dTDP-4-dehydrorhamnose reductase [Gammaproteobacteria bacterium]|nr:dTDP-4-dehydrorhamnose reductase [Gammaproteobacteria bacterium]